MSDKLEALKAAALAIGHECWVQDGSSVNTEDYRIANGEMCCDHIGCFESVNGESPHAKYVAAASPAVALELLAALEEKGRHSMSTGQADQRLCESRAVRIALGFGEDAIDVAPTDLVESIQAIRNVAVAAEKSLIASREVVALYDERLKEAEQRIEAAGRREEHLKADVALMAQRNEDLEFDVRVADGIIANHQKLNAELEQRLQPLNFETSAEEFLAHCLKAEEISGDKQQTRIKELIGWFSRYYRQAANPKWLSGHVAELCYFIIKNAQAEQRLQQPIKLPERYSVDFGVVCDPSGDWLSLDDVVKVLGDAGVEVRSPCPRCNRLLDLTSRPDGAHYCHHKVEGE